MKTLVCMALAALLLLACAAALADVDLTNRTLTNKALLKPIRASAYADWTLYQPESREIPADVTKVKEFRKYPYFPVVAVNGNDAALLLLKRVGSAWKLVGESRTALSRPGCTLKGFNMDCMMSAEEPMFIGLYFELADGGNMELYLQPWHDTRRFGGISYHPAERAAENLYADAVEISFNSGLKYAYRNQATQNTWAYYLDTDLPLAAEYENFDVFDLAQAPLTIMEAMVPGVIAQDTMLWQFPGESGALARLSAGDKVLVPYDRWQYQHMDWVPVCFGGAMGYVPRASVAGAAE